MAQVFISYSRKDISFVRRLAKDLANTGINTWWDVSGIQGSDIWEKKIEDGLNNSQFFIVVLTPDSIASRWVRREYLSADSKGLVIIPLQLKPCDDIPLTLRDIQSVDAMNLSYEDTLSKVLMILGVTRAPKEKKRRLAFSDIKDFSQKNKTTIIIGSISSFISCFAFISFNETFLYAAILTSFLGAILAGYINLRESRIHTGILNRTIAINSGMNIGFLIASGQAIFFVIAALDGLARQSTGFTLFGINYSDPWHFLLGMFVSWLIIGLPCLLTSTIGGWMSGFLVAK